MATANATSSAEAGHAGSAQIAAPVSDSAAQKRAGERTLTDSHVSTPSRSSSTTSSPDVAAIRRRKPMVPRRVNAADQARVTNGDGNGGERGAVPVSSAAREPLRGRRNSDKLGGEGSKAMGEPALNSTNRKRANGDTASDDGGELPAHKLARMVSTTEVESSTSTNSEVQPDAGKPSPTESRRSVHNGESGAPAASGRNGDDAPSTAAQSRHPSETDTRVNLRPLVHSGEKQNDLYEEALKTDSFFWLDSQEWLSRTPRTRPYAPAGLPHFLFDYLRKVHRQPGTDQDATSNRKLDRVYMYRCAECADTFLSESSYRMHRGRRTNLIFYECPYVECLSETGPTAGAQDAAADTDAQPISVVNGAAAETDTTKPKRLPETRPVEVKKGRLRFYNRCSLLSHVRRHGVTQIDARRVSVAAIPFEFWRADYLLGLVGTAATDPARLSELENLFAPPASCTTQPTAASVFVPSLLPIDDTAPPYAQSLNPVRVAPSNSNGDALFEQAEAALGNDSQPRPDSLRARLLSRNDELRRRHARLALAMSRRDSPNENESADNEPANSLRARKRSLRTRIAEDGARQRLPVEAANTAQRERFTQAQQEPIDVDDDRTFVCQSCSQSFQSREQLGAHLNTMRTAPSISCTLCQLPCATECQHEAHMRLHRVIWNNGHWGAGAHGDRDMVMCPECGLLLATSDMHELRTHVRVTCCHFQRTLMFVCSKCQRAFYNLTQLREHLLRLHATNGLACPVQSCSIVFATFEQLAAHATRKHTGVPLDLEACAARAAQSGGANSLTKCPICADLFPVTPNGRAAFERHVDETHLKASSIDIQTFVYRCIHCLQLFSGPRVLCPHLSRQHRDAALVRAANEPPATRVACLFCAESYPSLRDALLHEQCDHIQVVAAKPASNIHTPGQRNL